MCAHACAFQAMGRRSQILMFYCRETFLSQTKELRGSDRKVLRSDVEVSSSARRPAAGMAADSFSSRQGRMGRDGSGLTVDLL